MATNFKILGYGHTGMTVRSSMIATQSLQSRSSLLPSSVVSNLAFLQTKVSLHNPEANLLREYMCAEFVLLTSAYTAVSNSVRFWRDTLGLPITWEHSSPAGLT